MNNFDKINLEKGMYLSGNLSDVLESMDPSENYYGTPLQDLDAFSRQLKRYDIKVSGIGSDTIEKFFATSNSAVLFPEFVRRCVQAGMDENNAVTDIIANNIDIAGLNYRSVCANPNDATLNISTSENLVHIHNHNRLLQTSYDSLRFQRISTLSVILRQLGCYIARCQYEDALDLLGNSYCIGSIGHRPVDNIINRLAEQLYTNNGYNLNALLCPSSEFELLRAVLKNSFVKPENIKIHIYPNKSYHKIVGIDTRYGLEMISCGGVKVDYEKLIDRQFENAKICAPVGFSVVCQDAMVSAKISN